MPSIPPRRVFTRRRLLQLSGLSGISLLTSGCTSQWVAERVGQVAEPLNQRVEALLLKPQALVPEFPTSVIEPLDALLINTFDTTPQLDPAAYRLTIDGEVGNPLKLSLADIQQLTLTSMVMRHVCVEGWAAIVQWNGAQLRALIALAQPQNTARYVYFESADGYYESWDLASALHPQTLLAYQRNGQPLSVANGAPLRLAAPTKLGYKQAKWVTRVRLVNQLLPQTGYWEDQGYEWFGGL